MNFSSGKSLLRFFERNSYIDPGLSQIVSQIKRVRRSIPTLGNVSLSQVVDYCSSEKKPAIDYRDRGEKEEAR